MNTIRTAAILTIGDELMIGQIADTNSTWIASFLDQHGWRVTRKFGVRDDIPQIIEGISQCLHVADLLIITGGLGPTKDDLTVDALCQYFGCKKIWHEETWQRIISLTRKFGREPSEIHKRQCFQPEMAEIILNDHGSAPGTLFRKDNKIIISLPGVPNEMKHLLNEKIIQRLPPGDPVEHRFIQTAGEGETVIAEMITDIESSLPESVSLAYLPHFGSVTLRLSGIGAPQADLLNHIQNLITSRLGHLVFGLGDITLSMAIGELLRKRGETLSTAESCTGGYLAHMLTAVAGSSDYFLGSVIAYANEIKTSLLNVPEKMLATHGAVSEEVVGTMAEGVRKKLGTTWAISTSGVAGPGGGTPGKPVGTIWVACVGPNGTKTRLLNLSRDRMSNIEYTSIAALTLLHTMLIHVKR